MENQNPTRTQSDIISSTLPEYIIEEILSLMPIRDALRTSILSKKWRYAWQGMPDLVFTNDMVTVPSNSGCKQLNKMKLVSAIFHVLLLHNGPKIVKFCCSIGHVRMDSAFTEILSCLAKGNRLKFLIFINDNRSYKLPVTFFSLQGLEQIYLQNCTFEPPLTLNRFSQMRCVTFVKVQISSQMLQQFLSKCPLLEYLCLNGYQRAVNFVAEGNTFTFVDLLQCVPLIKILDIKEYYMKYLCAGGMPHKLPTSPVHLQYLFLDVCMMERNQISSALCMMRSSPALEKITIRMCHNEELPAVQQTPTNFLDPEGFPDLKLDHLEILEINEYRNLHLEIEFVKLIMAKSPVLKRVPIELDANAYVDEQELDMLRDLVLSPILPASPSAKLTIVQPKAS